ncbi:hypothetical protein T07_2943 [Trichinella nelsoni]|uniref:Uncharacterized protein n=1 Tax=Trichinella nelsoni TaxID=6336 RepID=A0A0V0RFP2_9BILA|nr:hypothetical protein T07_2943 [Trichinella nelsoni]
MEEKKKELKNASAHCSTMDASDARCQRWIAKSVQQIRSSTIKRSTLLYYKSTVLQNKNHSLHEITINTMSVLAAFIFFFMAVMHEINADSSALEEAKNYIYQSDLQSGKGHFRRVLDVKDVDTSEGLSLTIDALSTTCPVSSELSQEQVYSDECPTTKVEYDEIECHLKLDHSKTGQLECTYYGA